MNEKLLLKLLSLADDKQETDYPFEIGKCYAIRPWGG